MTDHMSAARPRLLFFRWTRPGLAPFVHDQLAEQLRCLEHFFDVALIDQDGDFDALCDRFEPDLVLFESGVYVGPRRLDNVHTHPEIPRVGFLNSDAFDPVRGVFLSDMDRWGVETFFTVSVAMGDYTPEIADRIFYWPNFVNPSVHRDHGLPKVVPILLTGSQARHYPWRNRVNKVLAQHYPTLSTPHFGWLDSTGARRMPVNEEYSRLINVASFAPSCGNFTRDFVRKHLEIPASRSCLIAQPTPALAAAGFVDMVNCVLADEDDVLDKVEHLLAHPDELRSITDAGHRLVHEQHTAERRTQIRDWYELFCRSRSSSGIVQDGPFAGLRRSAGPEVGVARDGAPSEAEDRVYLRDAWSALAHGRLDKAERAFTGASSFQYLPEAEVGRAVAQLLDGRAADAGTTVAALMGRMDRLYEPQDPDPVQWSVHVWSLLCQGRLEEAREASRAHPALQHEELARTRAVVAALAGDPPPVVAATSRASVNPLPRTEWEDWLQRMATMLRSNGQSVAATRMRGFAGAPPVPPSRSGRDAEQPGTPARRAKDVSPPTVAPSSPHGTLVGAVPVLVSRLAGSGAGRVREQARRWVGQQWLDTLADVVEREMLDLVLIVGPSRMSLRERSLRLAAARNPRMPEIAHVAGDAATLPTDDRRTLVHLGRRAVITPALGRVATLAQIVVLEDVRDPEVVGLADRLTWSGDFELVAHSRDRGGYFVFRHELGRSQAARPRGRERTVRRQPQPQQQPQQPSSRTHGDPA